MRKYKEWIIIVVAGISWFCFWNWTDTQFQQHAERREVEKYITKPVVDSELYKFFTKKTIYYIKDKGKNVIYTVEEK